MGTAQLKTPSLIFPGSANAAAVRLQFTIISPLKLLRSVKSPLTLMYGIMLTFALEIVDIYASFRDDDGLTHEFVAAAQFHFSSGKRNAVTT